MRRQLISLALSAGFCQAFGQTCFRTELLRFQGHFKDHPQDVFFGFGIDRQVSDRTSYGVTLNLAWASLFSAEENDAEYTRWREYEVQYTPTRAAVNLDFRSDFALSDIEERHLFLGTTAAVSWLRASASTVGANGPNSIYFSPAEIGLKERYTKTALIFPVGIRGGVRGGLGGSYAELYVGYGVNLGPEAVAVGAPFLGKGVPVAPTFLQFGLAVGFGG